MKLITGALITAVLISTNLSNSGAATPMKKPDYLMERLCKEQNYQMAMCRQYGSPKLIPKPKLTDLTKQGRKCTQYEKDLYINGCKR